MHTYVDTAPFVSFPKVGRLALLCVITLTFNACGYVDCKTKRDNFYAQSRKSDELGVIRFKDDENGDPYYSMSVKKIKRGYALRAPLYEDDDGVKANFTVQRDKEFKTFSGFQLSYGF